LSTWASQILDECKPIAAALDAHAGNGHTAALSAAFACLRNPAMLPSARMLDAMVQAHAGSYADFVLAQSAQHAHKLLGMPFPDALRRRYARAAQRSLAEQRKIEAADVLPFEEFRREYVSLAS
jgi:glutamate--cysteine ligase